MNIRSVKINYFTVFVCCMLMTATLAKADNYWFAFTISAVDKKGSDKFLITIDHGSDVGLTPNQSGQLWASVHPNREGESRLMTNVVLQEVSLNKSTLLVESKEPVYVGDVVFVELALKSTSHSIYFFLAQYGIVITNEEGKPYYTLDEILQSDGPRLRTEKFIAMQQAINNVGGKLKESSDKSIVKEGRQKGKLLQEVLVETDTMKVWAYLYHLVQNYTQTLGKTISLNNDYTDYCLQGDRITAAELKSFFTVVDSADWKQNFSFYQKKINTALVESWYKEAKDLRENKHNQESADLLYACIFLSKELSDHYNTGKYEYEMALVAEANLKNEFAAYWFKQADKSFEKAKSLFGRGYALHFMAAAYANEKKNVEAEKGYKEAIAIRTQLTKTEPTNADYKDQLYTSIEALALLYNSLEDYQATINYYNQALQLAQENNKIREQGDCYWNRGYAYALMNNYKEGIVNYEQGFKIFSELKDSASMIELKKNLAINYNRLKNEELTKEQVDDAIALARGWGKDATLAAMLDYQGELHYEHKQYGQSILSYGESEKIYNQLKDTVGLLKTKKKLRDAYKESKQYSKASIKDHERINLINKKELSKLADAYWDLALLQDKNYLKNPKMALEYYGKVEKIYGELKDTINRVTILNNIAYEYRDMGDSINAYKFHERALALAAGDKYKAKRADAWERKAYSYGRFKNKKKQMAAFNESLKLLLELNDVNKAGSLCESIAEAYQTYFDYTNAEIFFLKSIDYHHQEGSKKDEADSYWDLAYNQGQNLKLYDRGIATYRKACDLYLAVGDSVNASVMLSNIAQNYWSKLDFTKAIEFHKAAIDLADKCKNYEQVSSSWSKLATLYTESNNPVASTEALIHAVDAVKKINDSTLIATTYHDLSANYSKAKNYNAALDYINQAISIRKALRDTINWTFSLSQLAGIYQAKSDFKQATIINSQALTLQRKARDKSGIVYSLIYLGFLAQVADNNYKQAEVYFNEAIKLSTELKDDNLLAFCYSRMKGLQRSQGKTALAEMYIKKALELYTKSKQWKDVAATWVDIGYDESYIYGNNPKAMEWINKAQVIADTLNDVSTKAMLLSNRAFVLREMGEFKEALEYSNEGLKLYQQLDNDWGMAGAYIDIGNNYKQLSEYTIALQNQQRADSLYRKGNAEYSRLAPLANIGEIYTAQGDYKKGLEYYEQSHAIMKKANDLNENLCIVQSLIGESYFFLGNYMESDKWLKEALKTSDIVGAIRPKMDALAIIGRLKIEEQKYDEAFKYLSEGARISKERKMRISYAGNLGLLGQLEVVRKNYTKAKPLLEECIVISRDMGKYSTLWESLYWLGVLYKENKQLTESSKYLKESIEVIEKIRNKVSGGEEARKLFSSDKNILKVYEALVSVLLEQGETDLAMSYLQKNNEDNLKEKFKGLDVKFENADKNKVIERERDMKAKLDGIEKQIENEKALPTEKRNIEKLKNLEGIKTVAEGDYLKFVNQQVNVRPELSKFFNNSVQPAQLKGKKKQIPTDMALLSYLPGENQLYIFIATSDTVLAKVVDVPRALLTRNINAVLNIIRTSQGSFDQPNVRNEKAEREEIVNEVKQRDILLKPFEDLYHNLIAPASAEISGKRRLCIIPNGSLSYIPFQLLGKTLSNGKFSLLMNQFAIFYANSTDMLLRPTGGETRKLNILAFGNPDNTLPSTEKEVVEIKSLYPNSSVYLREEATEDKAKFAGEEFNVMHFATHGNLDYEDFGKSFLTMAENASKHEDGLLTLEELWGMDVMSHLNIVVLSACQTAVSKGSDESSPVSPASGFLQNGVRSVVATLWKVDDEATSIVMQYFYKNMQTMDAVDALRQAQVSLSNNPKFSHPYYWAGAVLLGDWR